MLPDLLDKSTGKALVSGVIALHESSQHRLLFVVVKVRDFVVGATKRHPNILEDSGR